MAAANESKTQSKSNNMKIKKIDARIAALYLWQKCDIKWIHNDPLDGAFSSGDVWHDSPIHGAHITRLERVEVEITPYLRRLDSMTEEEAREVYTLATGMVWEKRSKASCIDEWWELGVEDSFLNEWLCVGTPAVWLYLLSKGFDIFGLIDSGLAKEITL